MITTPALQPLKALIDEYNKAFIGLGVLLKLALETGETTIPIEIVLNELEIYRLKIAAVLEKGIVELESLQK